ncbi:bone morphogenetic protein 1-like [Anneissia japonica]|uniref:bone morphogenetic protein 1-like n=1 Tax=Anneissia japonica TaxID=1529436 RepID=UPI001425653D|nr:bone morphogenetic protein 1-like [Anneissia japonica]
MMQVEMKSIICVSILIFCGLVSAKKPLVSKLDQSLRYRRNVDVSNKYTQLTINTLRVHLNNEDLYFCGGDPYAGVQCPEEIMCVDWQQLCDGEQTCGVPYKNQCVNRTIASYGTNDKRMCDGDENERWCVWKEMAPQRCGKDYFIGGDKKSKRRRLRSMNFPKNYDNDRFCFWRIRVPEGDRISIYFRQFNTELNYDYVSVGNGEKYDNDRETVIYKHSGEKLPKPKAFTSTGVLHCYCLMPNLLRSFSGSKPPNNIVSKSNQIWVKFETNVAINRKGFEIHLKEKYFSDCGGQLQVKEGSSVTMASPNFPDKYDPSLDCKWRFSISRGRQLTFVILEFNTEENYDKFSLGDGLGPDENMTNAFITRYSGHDLPSPPVYTTTGSEAWMIFTSDNVSQMEGFLVQVYDKEYYDELFPADDEQSFSFESVPLSVVDETVG